MRITSSIIPYLLNCCFFFSNCSIHIGANLHNAGDFELQVGLLETLSRFTDVSDRRSLGPAWFNRINLTDQYLAIKEEEFDIASHLNYHSSVIFILCLHSSGL